MVWLYGRNECIWIKEERRRVRNNIHSHSGTHRVGFTLCSGDREGGERAGEVCSVHKEERSLL